MSDRAMWEEMGTSSPKFRAWSGGIEPTQLPSARSLPDSGKPFVSKFESLVEDPTMLGERYAAGYNRVAAQMPNPDGVRYIDQVAYTPGVTVVHHTTPGMRGTTIDYDAGGEFGLHAGTSKAAQDRQHALSESTATLKPKPPPLPLGQGRVQPSYDAERVFYFKHDKLLPLIDPMFGKWTTPEIVQQSIKSAERLGEVDFASDLKKYISDEKIKAAEAWGTAGTSHNYTAQDVRDIYKKHGFDGVISVNQSEDVGSLSIIAIDDASLKLAADAPDLGKVTGEFKPTGLYGAGIGAAGSAELLRQRRKEAQESDL